jgi:hypothetical protein
VVVQELWRGDVNNRASNDKVLLVQYKTGHYMVKKLLIILNLNKKVRLKF